MAPLLLRAGHEVVGLDSDLYRNSTFRGAIRDVPAIDKDIRDVRSEDLEGFDAVIHLAALSNDPLGDLDPGLTDEINHVAAVRLATLGRRAGVQRFVLSSSCSTYGAAGDDLIDESAEFNPVTPYGRSKVMAERGIAALACDSFSPVFLRSATAYGVSPRLRFDLVLNNLVAWACATGRVHIKSDGTPWRPIVHIEDISRAFIAVLEAPRELIHNRAFNVGRTEENYRVRELADIVAETVPGCEIEYAKDAGPDTRCYRVDCGLLPATVPSFRPKWTAREGARELYDSYRSAGLTVADFEGPRYKRVDHLRQLISNGEVDQTLRWRKETNGDNRAKSMVAGRVH
jgi:nucleoside-diphosphate-sugar epimerase